MSCEETNQSIPAANLIYCELHPYGCRDAFPPNESSKHYSSDTHFEILINCMRLKKEKYEDALINLAMNPMGVDEFSSSAAITVNNYPPFIRQLTDSVVAALQPSKPIETILNGLSNIERIYNATDSLSRNLIEQADRSSNHGFNPQSIQNERQLNEMTMNSLSSRILPSSDRSNVNRSIERDKDPPPATEQSTIELLTHSNTILKIKLEETPVSTDGKLVWHIDETDNKIKDAASKKRPSINSPPFKASMDGHRLYARLYLHGKSDPKFISLHVHLNPPIQGTFRGNIKFVLVDQSTNDELHHIIKSCSGEMIDVDDGLGFNDFVDKNILHKEGNVYVRNNSVYFLICVEQTNQEKYVNLPPNVQDALNVV